MSLNVGAGAEEVTEVPVCPRHPDRVSFVTCQRCGRPACPECQRPAAVGVQCVDCVKQQGKVAPKLRTVLGAPYHEGRPIVTMSIIGLCVLMFAGQFLSAGRWTQMFAFMPALGLTQPWRFLTAEFTHSTGFIGHILFNMMALWMPGPLLEKALGRLRFITLCAMCAIGGSVGSLLLSGSPADLAGGWYTPVVGASGMVFGLFGALIPILKRIGGNPRQIFSVLAINGALGFLVPGIAWQAHLGGFLVGLALGYVYAHAPEHNQGRFAVAMPALIGAALIAFIMARYAVAGWLTLAG
jgi:membrane associated rhomboid family serine protease